MFNSEYRMSHGISLWQVKRRTSSKLNSGTFWQRYGEYSAKTVLVVLRLIKPTGTDYIYQRTVVLYFMTVSGASYSIWSILYSMDRGKWMKWRWIMYIWCNISTIFYYCMLIRRINMWSTWGWKWRFFSKKWTFGHKFALRARCAREFFSGTTL